MRRAAAVIGTAIFFVFVPCVLAGVVPWWISRWEFQLSFLGVRTHALRRRRADSCRRSRARGFIRSFCAAGARHAGADRPAPTPRRYRPVSLRAQSHVRCRRRRHSGPSDPVRRLASHDLRRAHVARLPRLCPDVRGAGACSEVWGPVRGFSGQRSAVDSAAVSMAHRIRPPAQWRRRGERGRQNSKPAAHYRGVDFGHSVVAMRSRASTCIRWRCEHPLPIIEVRG